MIYLSAVFFHIYVSLQEGKLTYDQLHDELYQLYQLDEGCH